jgi:hypothetical protein
MTSSNLLVSEGAASVPTDKDARLARPSRPGGYQWAELTQRTFGVDVFSYPRCGGRLRLVALIEEASVIRRILRHLAAASASQRAFVAHAGTVMSDRSQLCSRTYERERRRL